MSLGKAVPEISGQTRIWRFNEYRGNGSSSSFVVVARTWKRFGRGRIHDSAANKHTSPCQSHGERNPIMGQMQQEPCRIPDSRVKLFLDAALACSPSLARSFHILLLHSSLVSSALIGLYMVVQLVTTSSTLQNCCGRVLHRSALHYTLSPLCKPARV